MRLAIIALLLLLSLSMVQALPLNGGNGAVNCTLFGVVKSPVGTANLTLAKEMALKVDIGLLGAENATYELKDSQNNVYRPDLSLTADLQPGRKLITFIVPKDALFLLLKVIPDVGNPFSINWWKTPKGITGDITIRYYGLVDAKYSPDQQSTTYELTITNNGQESIPLSPENFTLLDQWGWQYFTLEGFASIMLAPKKTTSHIRINFSSLSPLSKPTVLIYDYLTPNQIAIDLEKDTGPLSDSVVYGTNAIGSAAASSAKPSTEATAASTAALTSPKAQVPASSISSSNFKMPPVSSSAFSQPPATSKKSSTAPASNSTSSNQAGGSGIQSVKDKVAAAMARLEGIKQSGIGSNKTVAGGINSSVAATRERLAKMVTGLHSNKNDSSGNSTIGNSTAGNSTAS